MAKINDETNSRVGVDLTLAKEGSVIVETQNDMIDDVSLVKF
jgi:hypothetical protein